MQFYDAKSSEPEIRYVDVRLAMNGATTPVIDTVGSLDITVARSGVGVYTLTFRQSEGDWGGLVGMAGLEATTGTDTDGWTVNHAYATATRVLTVRTFNEANAAADPPTATWLNLTARFKAGRTRG